MSLNRFTPEKFHDFTIVDEKNQIVGHIRLKPSGVHWAPKNSKKWYGIPIEEFGKLMEENGKRKSK